MLGVAQSEHGQGDLNIVEPGRSIFKLLLYFLFYPPQSSAATLSLLIHIELNTLMCADLQTREMS